MAVETGGPGGQRFVAPSGTDPAAYAIAQQRMAEQIDARFGELSKWSLYPEWLPGSGGGGEVGTPAILRSLSGTQGPFEPVTERPISWNNTVFDNTGSTHVSGDLIIPEQDQRYWWWACVHSTMASLPANTRMRVTVYTQDQDPVTGNFVQGTLLNNSYSAGVGIEYMTFDGFIRSGGGRVQTTFLHTDPGSYDMQSGASLLVVRICPDRL